jgi:hypothetical protein
VAAWINYGPDPPEPGPWNIFADLPFPRSEQACAAAAKKEPSVDVVACILNARIQNWRDGERAAWTILPPIVVLMAGLSIAWVAKGLR